MITLDKERIFKMALAFMKVTKKPDEFLTESLGAFEGGGLPPHFCAVR